MGVFILKFIHIFVLIPAEQVKVKTKPRSITGGKNGAVEPWGWEEGLQASGAAAARVLFAGHYPHAGVSPSEG